MSPLLSQLDLANRNHRGDLGNLLCDAAEEHGANAGDSDHELGDLRALLVACLQEMQPAQVSAVIASLRHDPQGELADISEYDFLDL
jgi:hypothetical protein